jgi:hypothetical protein
MIPTPSTISNQPYAGHKGKPFLERAPQQEGLFPVILARGLKMKTQKRNRSTKPKKSRKRHSRGTKRNAITWADPTVNKTTTSRKRKTKRNKDDMRKNSCWWFG